MDTPVHMLAYRLARECFRDLKILNPGWTFADAYKYYADFYEDIGPEETRKYEKWYDKNIRLISRSKGLRKRAKGSVIELPSV